MTAAATRTPVVTPASPADLDALAALLAAAFAREPQVRSFVGEGPGVVERIRRLHRAELRGPLAAGTVDVVRAPDDGAPLAAAVWHAPGAAGLHPGARLGALRDHLAAFGVRGLPRALAVARALGRSRPAAPHWYLEAVGAAPAGRGRGLGTRLLEHRLALVDAAGQACALESSSPRTTPLYRRLGFLPLGPVRGLPSAEPPLAMWRPPLTRR